MTRDPRLTAAFALALAGCAAPAPIRTLAAPAPGNPSPVVSAALPRPAAPPPTSLYREPRVGVVYLRAYQDAQGRLVGPQWICQVTDPGGWDLEAVERLNGAPPTAGLAPALPAREPPPAESPLLDARMAGKIALTGLMTAGDRAEAEAMAARRGTGWSPLFDPQAGWLLVPPRN